VSFLCSPSIDCSYEIFETAPASISQLLCSDFFNFSWGVVASQLFNFSQFSEPSQLFAFSQLEDSSQLFVWSELSAPSQLFAFSQLRTPSQLFSCSAPQLFANSLTPSAPSAVLLLSTLFERSLNHAHFADSRGFPSTFPSNRSLLFSRSAELDSNDDSSQSGGLSTLAMGGIALGALIAAAGLIFLILRLRRGRNSAEYHVSAHEQHETDGSTRISFEEQIVPFTFLGASTHGDFVTSFPVDEVWE
jgi:hypothetical protein